MAISPRDIGEVNNKALGTIGCGGSNWRHRGLPADTTLATLGERRRMLVLLVFRPDRHTLSQNSASLKNFCDMSALGVGQFRMPQRAGITKNLLANRRSSSPEPALIPAAPDGIPDIKCHIQPGPCGPASLEKLKQCKKLKRKLKTRASAAARTGATAPSDVAGAVRVTTKPTRRRHQALWKSCSSASPAVRSIRRSSRKCDA